MKLINDEQLLDEDFRKKVIDEIEGIENQKRKAAMKKRYDVYKDYTKTFVLEMMRAESEDDKVVQEVIHRLSNISFCKKVIDKKAMVYKDGVKREVYEGKEETQKQLEQLVDLVNINKVMKKTNRFEELFKNALAQVLPYVCPATGKYYYMMSVLAPYLYDVIEDNANPEMARAYIYSYHSFNSSSLNYAPENMSGYRELTGASGMATPFRSGDNVDQILADAPNDKGANKKEYIWWSNKYHFTTDEKGLVLADKSPDDLKNPIGELPQENFSQDQDGQFWSVGGEDIIDGSILLNMLLSDIFYIAKYQGCGIGYMFGKGVPKNLKVGASSFVTLDMEEGDPTPSLGFATSNPPINAHLDMIEKYVAFLLSTNNLEPGTVQGQLSAAGAASGIQEMVRRAENMDDIQDQREIYRDGEPRLFRIMAKWHNLYLDKGQLKDEFAEIGKIDEDLKVKIRFADPQPFITEKEKVEIIKNRLEIGLDSMIDAIIKDNPDLSEEEAAEKLRKIMEEKLIESSRKMKLFTMGDPNGVFKKEAREDEDVEEEDELEDEDVEKEEKA